MTHDFDFQPDLSPGSSHIIRSYAEQIDAREAFRLNLERRDSRVLMANSSIIDPGSMVDVSWLPAAAEEYKISPDIRDYILCTVNTIEGSVPNRNMHCFLTSRMLKFSSKYGCQVYKTFIGKPVHYEHQHDDDTKAKGVIFDASMHCVGGRWFTSILKGFDRTKDKKLAAQVLSGERTGHSMSAYCSHFDCSVCGHRWDTQWQNACECMKGPRNQQVAGRYNGAGQIYNGALAYMVVDGICMIEDSSVGDQANHAAVTVGKPFSMG